MVQIYLQKSHLYFRICVCSAFYRSYDSEIQPLEGCTFALRPRWSLHGCLRRVLVLCPFQSKESSALNSLPSSVRFPSGITSGQLLHPVAPPYRGSFSQQIPIDVSRHGRVILAFDEVGKLRDLVIPVCLGLPTLYTRPRL